MQCYIVLFRKEQEEDINKIYKEANFIKGKSYVAVENNGSITISDENNKDWVFRIDNDYNLIQYPSIIDFFSCVDTFECRSKEELINIKEEVSEAPIGSVIFIFARKVLALTPREEQFKISMANKNDIPQVKPEPPKFTLPGYAKKTIKFHNGNNK